MTNTYDSTNDTRKHIVDVIFILQGVRAKFLDRATKHDASKLESPEKEVFDEYTPKLKDSTYGSEEYKSFLKEMEVGLKHHYENNRHHPEHHEKGISDMTLLDLLEMLADWKAASQRHNDGSMKKSLKINAKRFNIPKPLVSILTNTAYELGMLE